MTVISSPPRGLDLADGMSISVVIYHPDVAQLEQTLASLREACGRLLARVPRCPIELFLIDNGGLGDVSATIGRFRAQGVTCHILTGHGNIGYGRGHNLAIDRARGALHLILNPDVDLDADAFVIAYTFLEAHSDVGLLAPRIGDEAGQLQYLCRRFPSITDLFVRGFVPLRVRRMFEKRLAHYEMHDVVGEAEVVWDPPIISGCFMLFRTSVLKALGGFDARYFLYFEDYDLSLRAHDVARVAYVPAVRVIHHGGGASRKGFAHIRMFAASAFKFYNRFGWRLW
ncbi:glycosyltransferase family 2 protein [Burkholderia multivorans]|uniref:glycosyltransferase family 2 protein n=1 Tax=Burkholderia multivorans TaxID=87883 RepID=UPI0021D88A8B|nr:glycosyltransferase family 2 protein [Burkholderia multivorans]UXZ61879.1 glycosyltransferase family 2 protein [Burkholderia multivorans]